MNDASRQGFVLLEVLVAMTILLFGCVVVLDATNGIISSALHTSATEASVMDADQYMVAISLWPRNELDRHLGSHRRGDWILSIQRVSAALYDVSIADSTARREWIRTTLYRPIPKSEK